MFTWQTFMVIMVRWMINDFGTPPNYTDARLEQVITLAGQLAQGMEIAFPYTYTFDVPNAIITPDPTQQAPIDNVFINLVSLKAACIIDTAEARTAAGQGISIGDSGSTISLIDRARNKILMLDKGFCTAYETAKLEFMLGSQNPGVSIVSPFKFLPAGVNIGGRVIDGRLIDGQDLTFE